MDNRPPDYDSLTNPHHPDQQYKRLVDYLSDDGWGRKLVLDFDVVGLVNRHRAEFQKMMQRCREQVFEENRRWVEDYYAGDWPETAKGKKWFALWERYGLQRGAMSKRLSPDEPNNCLLPEDFKEFLPLSLAEFGADSTYFERDVLLDRHEDRAYGETFWTFPLESPIEAKIVAVVMLHNHTANPNDQLRERKIEDFRSEPMAIRRWHTLLARGIYDSFGEGASIVANTGEAVMQNFLADVKAYLEAVADPPEPAGENGNGTPPATVELPVWNEDLCQLSFRGKIVRTYKRTSQACTILAAFSEDGWKHRIDIPLPDETNLTAVIRRMNDGVSGMKFGRDGTGEGIVWTETK